MTAAIARIQASGRSPARTVARGLAVAFGALALACGGAQAQGHGGFHGGGGYHGGGFHGGYHGGYYRGWGGWPFWGVGVGLGLGLAGAYYYDQPDYVVVNQPPVYYGAPPVNVYQTAPAPAPAAAVADPIFYPRSGQNAAQTEADRQACNRWATTQPKAMADASIFQRATLACMDGRGYTSR